MSAPQQVDFGGGIFRSPRAPAGSVYDCIDGLIDDELAIYKRGGVAFKSDVSTSPGLLGVADMQLGAAARTFFWDGATFFLLDAVLDAVPSALALASNPRPYARPFGIGGLVALSASNGGAVLWGGSGRVPHSAGTITLAIDDAAVVGVGTSFTANVDPGMILGVGTLVAEVAEVVDDTHLKLRMPSTIAATGAAYAITRSRAVVVPGFTTFVVPGTRHIATVGSPARLVLVNNNRVYFSAPGYPASIDPTDFHELPAGSQILGLDSVRDVLVIFTTGGVWTVENMNLDLTDADGAPQQALRQISKDVILWDDAGVSGFSTYTGVLSWQGQFVVPALDDVYVFGIDSPAIPISRGIRSLYRSYVAAGYRPGVAEIFGGLYVLPIVNASNNVVDTLVCRLDLRDRRGQMRPAWTRFTHGAAAYAARVRAGDDAPSLFGALGARLFSCDGWLKPSAANKVDAGAGAFDLDWTTNDLEPGQAATLMKVMVGYELEDAAADNPTIAASYSTGDEGSALTALGTAGVSDGSVPAEWRVVQRARRFRLRFLSSGPSAKLRFRSLSWFVRDSSRP